MKKANIQRTVSLLIVSSMLLCVPTIESQAAVITSNATDKLAVIFDENTAYCAGDYVTYDGELYLCASDVQGIWDAAKASFIQITKNHALGEVSELSAEYESQKDPSEETSLMSFVANAWQKLKTFLGIGDHAAQTDKEHYKEAPVSAKLNYLETQNEDLEEHITNLQGKVNDSFQSVSNGKSLLADTITDKGIQIGSSATFQEFQQSVLDLSQLSTEKGRQEGIKEADGRVNEDSASYKAGNEAGIHQADGRVNENSASYTAGMQAADGRVNENSNSYQAGMQAADGRVNQESASYLQGVNDSQLKHYATDIRLVFRGPQSEADCFTFRSGGEDISFWDYKKTLPGHTMIYAAVTIFGEYYYSQSYCVQTAVLTDDGYLVVKEGDSYEKVQMQQDTLRLNGFRFVKMKEESTYVDLKVDIYYL